jgi:hypothetical protein
MRRYAVVVPALMAIGAPPPAHAVAALWWGGVSSLSLGVAGNILVPASGVVVATGAVVTNAGHKKAGVAIAIGGGLLALADPPGGTFYDGSWSLHYPTDLLAVNTSGWLGDWGANGDPAPPVDLMPGDIFTVQPPNGGLTTNTVNDAAYGLLTTTFDWGSAGHTESSSESFNFFAALFVAKENINVTLLGTGPALGDVSADEVGRDAGDPGPFGSNFYITSPGVFCVPSNDRIVRMCGEPVTQYYYVSVVPEPSAWFETILGVALLGAVCRLIRSRTRVSTVAATTA